MSRAVAATVCDERICVDDDTVTVEFPGGATRRYCRAHLPDVLAETNAEVVGHD